MLILSGVDAVRQCCVNFGTAMKNFKSYFKSIGQTCVFATLLATITAHAGTVSVSNYPLALLSNAVTQGAEPAQVLLGAGDVGHHGTLSPSGVKLVEDSDFVVWFGEELEQNLVNSLKDAPNAISLYRFKAFKRLPLRNLDGTPRQDSFDPHIWLDPQNAKAMVRALAVIHSHANPKNKELYLTNAKNFAKKMDEAVANLPKQSKPLPYWAYHDSYQYLENSAHLSFSGALTLDHHLSPKASQIKFLSTHRPSKFMCLVSQGKVSQGIINKLGDTSVSIQQEDMSDGTDFIDVWKKLTNEVYACINHQG